VKTEKSRGVAEEGECGDDVAGLRGRERRSLNILPVKKGSLQVKSQEKWWVAVRKICDVDVC